MAKDVVINVAAEEIIQMDQYIKHLKAILLEYAQFPPSHGEIEADVVFDDERGHYQLIFIGWDTARRVHAIIIHARLKNGKIWIEWDGTHEGIALRLVEAGVPHEAIVLGFQPPEMRPYTDFAVA
jgi:hypothetical protein